MYVTFRNIDPIIGTNTAIVRTIPVHAFTEDLAWITARTTSDSEASCGSSRTSRRLSKAFNSATTNASVIKGSGNDLIPAGLSLKSGDMTSYEYGMVAVLGIVTSATANYNNTSMATIIPPGAPVVRNFVNQSASSTRRIPGG